jgi:hypothetical protein
VQVLRACLRLTSSAKLVTPAQSLRPRDRVGGRNWTIRRGTKLDMTDGTRQVCEFDHDMYWNAGPARIPSHHQAVLGYCRELGVELEVEINESRGSRLLNPAANGGKPLEMRQAVNDTRGAISELLAKAVNRGALDQELTVHDKERLLLPIAWLPANISRPHFENVLDALKKGKVALLVKTYNDERSNGKPNSEILSTIAKEAEYPLPSPNEIAASAAQGPFIPFNSENRDHLNYIRATGQIMALSYELNSETQPK